MHVYRWYKILCISENRSNLKVLLIFRGPKWLQSNVLRRNPFLNDMFNVLLSLYPSINHYFHLAK
jgi:hypothetical protein